MISVEKLQAVRKIVVHENGPGNACPDGMASAIILHDALPDAEVVFAAYGRPSLEELVAESGLLFCDITPLRTRVQEFVDAGSIVLDHHVHAKDVVEAFGAVGVYSDEPGVSGAVLAFREAWERAYFYDTRRAKFARRFAELAGVRDTWQKSSPDWHRACAQAEALRFWSADRWLAVEDPFWYSELPIMLDIGPTMVERRTRDARNAVAEAFRFNTSFRGLTVAVISTLETSDAAELADADILVGFKYLANPADIIAPQLALSFRSRNGYDVGALAVSLGGGGHKAAAGARVPVGRFGPYEEIKIIVNSWDAEQAPV